MKYRSLLPILVLLAACAASACSGGGGGGSHTPPATPTPTATPTITGCTHSFGRAGSEVGRLAPRGGGGIVPDQLYVRYRTSAGTRGVQSIERTPSVERSVDLG